MHEISALSPIDLTPVPEANEEEKAAPWVMRKLVCVSSDSSIHNDYVRRLAARTWIVSAKALQIQATGIYWGEMDSLHDHHATKLPGSHAFRRPHPPQFHNMIILFF